MKTVKDLGMAVGTFEMSNEFIQESPELAMKVLGEVIVLEAQAIPNGIKYLALGQNFKETKSPLHYVAVFGGVDNADDEFSWVELPNSLKPKRSSLLTGTIEWAMTQLRSGEVVTRKSAPHQHLYMVQANAYPANSEYAKKFSAKSNGMVKYSAYIACLNTACEQVSPWAPTPSDLFAQDYEVYKK